MWLYGSGFPKATDISKQLDKVIGKQAQGFKTAGDDGRKAEFKQDKSFRSDYGYVWKPKGKEAKLWNGWKSHGLKPAYEPILVAMKPNEGSYANNALRWKVSGLNIDGARIGYKNKDDLKHTKAKANKSAETKAVKNGTSFQGTGKFMDNRGRFPANILLDEEAARMLDEQSGESGVNRRSIGCKRKAVSGRPAYGDFSMDYSGIDNYGDKGGASRFFYVAKASKAERNMGCEGLKKKQATGGGGGIGDYLDDVNSASGKYGSEKAPARNNHPTVKPLKLMEYLCLLTKTPTGGIVLDPFAGSGTTLMACKRQGRDFIGIEKEKEYCEIARARIKATPKPLL